MSSSDYGNAEKRIETKEYKHCRTMSDLVPEDEIEGLLKKLPEWDHEEKAIVRVLEFYEYMEAVYFVNDVADISED